MSPGEHILLAVQCAIGVVLTAIVSYVAIMQWRRRRQK
jgi:hypothetical protein